MRKLYIKSLFEDLNTSQERLAQSIGMYQSRLSKIINGKDEPTATEAQKLERFFGLPLYILLEQTITEAKYHEH